MQKLTHSDIYDVDQKSGALIIGANRLDDYATIFLKKYCEQALTVPMPLPVDDMLHKANLKIKTASLSKNFDVFGCCMMLDGYVQIYDPEKSEYVRTFYPAGTLLFDPKSEWFYGEGSKRNTLIHEMIHWDKDQTYFKILERKNRKAKEDLYPIMCRQSRTEFVPTFGKRTKQNEVEWLEWQAHRLAPRVLMPKNMFIKKTEQILLDGIDSCDNLVDLLADFFKVSRVSAKIRLTEVGIDKKLNEMSDFVDVFGELKRKEHVEISIEDAFELLHQNNSLQNWVEANHMIFADGYFVIADTKYITVKGGELHLTKRAKNNLAACTLNICEQHIVSRKIADKDYSSYAVAFHTSGVDTTLLSFHPKYQAGFKEYLKAETNKGKDSKLYDVNDDDVYDAVINNIFDDDDDERQFVKMLGDPDQSLCQCLWFLMSKRMRYPDTFWEKTLLHRNYHGKIKNDKYNNIGKEILLAVCIGLKLNLRLTQKVFLKAGIQLQEYTDPDKTYRTILERAPGISIDDFNQLLKRREIKLLGTPIKEDDN